MPPLVQRYVKTAFAFLLLGLLTGAVITISQNLLDRPIPLLLIVAHVHALLVGFVLMLIIGVATWMFPRPAQGNARYRPGLAAAIYWTLTFATALRFAAEVLAAWQPGRGLRLLIAAGGLGQALAGFLFVYNMWVRVRAPSTLREP